MRAIFAAWNINVHVPSLNKKKTFIWQNVIINSFELSSCVKGVFF